MRRFMMFLWRNKIFWALVITWVIIFFGAFLASEELEYQRIRVEEVENRLNEVNDRVNLLWGERLFINEMRENLAYYLPDSFVSKVEFVGIKPVVSDIGRARV